MASPIDTNPASLAGTKSQRTDGSAPRKAEGGVTPEQPAAAVGAEYADHLELSRAGRQLSANAEPVAGRLNQEQALDLMAQLTEWMATDPQGALQAQGGKVDGRLLQLLQSPA